MSIKWLLFSFEGRIARKTFWQWNLLYYFFMLLVLGVVTRFFPMVSGFVVPIFWILVLFPDLAVTSKRWHDRNKGNGWLLLNLPLILGRIAFPMAERVSDPVSSQPSLFSSVLAIVGVVCGAWIFIECGLLRGSVGKNAYGEEPSTLSNGATADES
ncbi:MULTISPECIES: DUF805 domain-containing protein [Vibrio]|uniref:DUF805 domain-containing protein n=2 Tax=Vibrio TaxID=662 RepID=A0A7X4LI05_9VIBR|nr:MULTISPECIES: DUF805 domain-containing protein [Vibrio]MBF9001820.1 DUF805 domain-containing protein [Vibrio nitrifigilis]MZI92267.1 DUF805 domain-containing protein [Vibrio eleionomae]